MGFLNLAVHRVKQRKREKASPTISWLLPSRQLSPIVGGTITGSVELLFETVKLAIRGFDFVVRRICRMVVVDSDITASRLTFRE